MNGERSDRVAYLAPFLVFIAFLLLRDLVVSVGDGYAHWALAQPQYWILPLQTVVCGALLCHFRSRIDYRPLSGFSFAAFIGLVSLVVWIAPQAFFGFPPRLDGFQPAFFGDTGWPYWANLTFRMVRMSVVVPFVEELFWRGFLLRFLIREDFASVPFGTFTWRSFLISSAAFCLEHQMLDWPAALLTGALFNLVAYRTRSLAACVFTHAVTNFVLGLWILRTGQWGFW
jgi:CAAX prenyl protease-like protein